MNSFNNNSLPIQSKSPMLLSKQINRPNIPAIKSLRMSDHTEYSKSLKINNSQSSSNIVNKRNTLDSLHHHNLTDEIPHNYSNYCTKHPKKKVFHYFLLLR